MVTIVVTGLQELMAKINRVIPDLRDYAKMWPEIRREVVNITEEKFDKQGPGWAPLSPAYAAWKLANFGQKPILEATGNMRSDLTSGLRMTGTQTEVEFSTNNEIWVFHQFGTSRMPARPIFKEGDLNEKKLTDAVVRYVEYSLKTAGLV